MFNMLCTIIILVLSHSLFLCANAQEIISVDFTTPTGRNTTHRMFGTVDTTIKSVINSETTTMMQYMAGMNLQFVRIVDPNNDPLAWTSSSSNWSTSVVSNYFNAMKSAYSGKPLPEFTIALKKWPKWFYDADNMLPKNMTADYAQMCAQLVKLIRIDLGITSAVYWQPFNNIERDYANNLGDLYDLYNEAAIAMKAIDPTIKVGPSFGTSTEDLYRGILSVASSNIDFVNFHYYLSPTISDKTTEQIFAVPVAQIYQNFYYSLKNDYPNLNIIFDEYALTYDSSTPDPRIRTNVAATWFASMHTLFADNSIEGGNVYNIKSNFAGLVDSTNIQRPSTAIFKWANNYFVGDIYQSSTLSGQLKTLAVKKGTISALYIINTANTNVSFSFSSIVGWNSSQSLVKNTVNESGIFTDETSLSQQGERGLGPYRIPAYSVWVLYFDTANPVYPPASFASLQILIEGLNTATFNETIFEGALARAADTDLKYVNVLSFANSSSSLLSVAFEIAAMTDDVLVKSLENLNTSLSSPSNEFTESGFAILPLSLLYLEINYQVPPTIAPTIAPTIVPSPEPVPDGYTCTIENGARICTRNYVPHEFSTGLAAGLGAIIGVGVCFATFAAIILVLKFITFTKKFGTFYCSVIIFGAFVSYAAAATLLPQPTDELCLAFPWLIGIAFTLVYGCLFIKAGILYRIWRYSMKLKRISVTPLTVIKYIGVALTIEIVLLVVWSAVDRPRVKQVEMVDHTLQAHCHSDTPTFWIIFLCLKGCWLLFGAVISVLTRDIIKEHNDFSAVAYAIYNNVILLAIAIPLAIVLEKVPNGTMIIAVIVIVLAFTFTIIILFYDTWLHVLFPNKFNFPGLPSSSNNSAGRSSAMQATSSVHRSSSHSHSPSHSNSNSNSQERSSA